MKPIRYEMKTVSCKRGHKLCGKNLTTELIRPARFEIVSCERLKAMQQICNRTFLEVFKMRQIDSLSLIGHDLLHISSHQSSQRH